jgi:hypothetical protein
MSQETTLFNKMIRHYIKSLSSDSTLQEKEDHHSMYEETKHELWSLYKRDRDVKLG